MSDLTHFLVGPVGSSPPAVPQLITQLRDASTLFCTAWAQGNLPQAQRASSTAMAAFDHICNAFLRARDDSISASTFSGSAIEAYLNNTIGLLVTPVTLAEQQANRGGGQNWGNGRLPPRQNGIRPAEFHVAFNKIKHRKDEFSNFRLAAGRHFVVLAGDRGQQPDYMFEFDVVEFCDRCSAGVSLI